MDNNPNSITYLKSLPDITPHHVRMMTPGGEIMDQEPWSVEECLDLYGFTVLARDNAEWSVFVQEKELEARQWCDRYLCTTEDHLWLRDCGVAYEERVPDIGDLVGAEGENRVIEARTNYRRLRRP
jgi:hypothetical protein